MKISKINYRIIAIMLIIFLSIPLIASAQSTGEIVLAFFTVDKQEVSKKEIVTMTLDMRKIDYEYFSFTLFGDRSLQQIDTNIEEIIMQKEESGIKMEVSKKALAIEKLQFYYEVPDTLQVGDTITLKATLTELVETKDKENTLENTNQANEVNNENSMQEGNKNVIEITLTVVDKKDKSIVEENNKTDIQKQEEKENSKVQKTITQKQQEEAIKTTSVTGISKTIITASSITQEETYQGSYNNYLTDIQIEGYSLRTSFYKTNQTYFITVENEITQLTITATTCDETASIQIYGNTDLQEGINKILISVTAENKEVRTYRIYVTREA